MRCWEFKKCGFEKDGACPAVANGKESACWLVAETFCASKVRGLFSEKIHSCGSCDFYIYKKYVSIENSTMIDSAVSQRR